MFDNTHVAASALAAAAPQYLPRQAQGPGQRTVLNLLGRNPGTGAGARRAAERFYRRVVEERARLAGGPAAY